MCLSCLQLLVSGSLDSLDFDDLRQHTNYAGGYHGVSGFYLSVFDWYRVQLGNVYYIIAVFIMEHALDVLLISCNPPWLFFLSP